MTRVDVAVTVHDAACYQGIPAEAYSQFRAWAKERPRAALGHYHEDTRGGSSLQLGERGSQRVLRVYNKEAEAIASHDDEGAAHYAGCARYELEFHDALAEKIGGKLAADGQRSDTIQATIYQFCTDHAITPVFEPTGGQALKTGFRRRSDYDSRIRWYSKSVAPSIAVALQQGEACEVLDALGLAHLLQPTVRESIGSE